MKRQNFKKIILEAGCGRLPENSFKEAERVACDERPLEAAEGGWKGAALLCLKGISHSQPYLGQKLLVLLFAVLALSACSSAQKDAAPNLNQQPSNKQQLDLVPFSRGPISPPNVKGP